MKREIIKTADGSATIYLPEWNEHYHSRHGAVLEARHVFLQAGLEHYLQEHQTRQLAILEIGFGTGLNAFLTCLEAQILKLPVHYTGIEAYPVSAEEVEKLDYASILKDADVSACFEDLHQVSWEEKHKISPFFELKKKKMFFKDLDFEGEFDLIFFDAFGPRVQPDLWTQDVFENMYKALRPNGILVTYSAKGSVRRAMQAVGFNVERLPGPPGKREMLRAVKAPDSC